MSRHPEEDGPVVVRHDDPLERVPMSWEQYLKLPERPRAEWVNGVAVIMNAPVSFGHGDSAVRLGAVLLSALPELYVVSEVKLKMSDDLVLRPTSCSPTPCLRTIVGCRSPR